MGLVIFDLDGTLLNTIEDLAGAMNATMAAHGHPVHTTDECRMMVGHGIRNFLKQAMPAELRDDDALVDRLLEEFKSTYASRMADRTVPYPGIPGLLSELQDKGFCLALASNKFQSGAEALMKEFFPDIRFSAILGNREDLPLKPDPEVVRMICSAAGIPASDTVMVGDSPTDIKTAANAGVRSIAVSWGFRPKSVLAEADAVADSVDELRELLLAR